VVTVLVFGLCIEWVGLTVLIEMGARGVRRMERHLLSS
jgi:hypothetical protein